MKRGRRLAGLALVFLVLAGGTFAIRARATLLPTSVAVGADSSMHAPAGVRIRVEVVNTTATKGLARRATRLLRDQGFDVVGVSTSGPTLDTTIVLDRSGHRPWATSIARLLGPAARAEARPDSSRYVDITVLLGTAWHPASQALNP